MSRVFEVSSTDLGDYIYVHTLAPAQANAYAHPPPHAYEAIRPNFSAFQPPCQLASDCIRPRIRSHTRARRQERPAREGNNHPTEPRTHTHAPKHAGTHAYTCACMRMHAESPLKLFTP